MKIKNLTHSYTDNIYNKRVVIFGLLPPPLGGISVHIKRVIHKLEQQNNYVTYMHAEKPWYIMPFYLIKVFFMLIYVRPHVVIFNSVYLSNSLLQLSCLSFFRKFMHFQLLCIEHNCRHMYKRSTRWKRLFKRILKHIDAYVFIGTSTYQSYKDSTVIPFNVSIESAFLPPVLQDEKIIMQTYPDRLNIFVQKQRPLLLVNAFQLVLLDDNKDLYGIDQCIEMLHELKKTYSNVGLIFALAKVGNQTYFAQLQQKIRDCNLQHHIFIISDQKELWPLFKKIDLFVRPTLSDGASISIDEALYFKVPVIASNVVDRQQGVILFDLHIKDDFINKVIDVLNSCTMLGERCIYNNLLEMK